MDPLTSSRSPAPQGIPPTPAPPDEGAAASPGRAAALAKIAAIRGNPKDLYHQGNAARIDEVDALYREAYGQPDPETPNAAQWTRPVARYELTVPDDLTGEAALPTILRQDAEGSMFELGFDRQTAQSAFDWVLGRSRTPPTLPESRTTADAAERTLREEWREGYDKHLFYARAGMNILDEIREQAGHGRGEIKALLRRSGHDNNPAAIRLFNRLGQWYSQTERERFRQFAVRRRSGD